jgi:hypothetical protein
MPRVTVAAIENAGMVLLGAFSFMMVTPAKVTHGGYMVDSCIVPTVSAVSH